MRGEYLADVRRKCQYMLWFVKFLLAKHIEEIKAL